MDEDTSNPLRRMSSRTRKVDPKVVAALASSDNRTQADLARLEALENDNAGIETVEVNSDDDASLDDEDQVYVKRQSKSTKRKIRQAKALENTKKAPTPTNILWTFACKNRSSAFIFKLRFIFLACSFFHGWMIISCIPFYKQANLESLPPHVPSYLRAVVGPPSSTSRRHFCTVCGFTAKYTHVRCGMRYCAICCQNIHNDTRCLKFLA